MYNIIIPRKPTELALRKLYLVDKLSVDEIADIYEYKHSNPIRIWLKKFKIPVRTREENCMLIYGVKNPMQLKEIKEKIKQTNLERRGVENPFQAEEIKEKIKQTNLKNHGVENPSQAEEFKEKKKQTNLKNHGVEYPLQAEEVKEKMKQTNLKRRGVEHHMQAEEFKEKHKQICLKNHGTEYFFQTEEFKEKSKETCLEKYGVEYVLQAKEFQEKKTKTMLERHGVKHALQAEEVKEKHKQTCLKNLGVEYPAQCKEVQEKIKQTCLENLGVEYPAQCKEVQEKIKQTCLKNYGVENPSQAEEVKEKHKQTCLKNYGVEYPLQAEEVKEKMKQTCLENLGVENPSQVHIKNYDIWNNETLFQEWIAETYNKLGRKLTTGDLNNFFNLTISNTSSNKLKELPEEYNKYYKIKASYLEPIVEDWIKKNVSAVYERNKKYDFIRNNNGNMMQLDFFFPSLKIAIEVNDNWSHNPEFRISKGMNPKEANNYEQIKTDLCAAQGISLIHLWEDDIGDIDNILGNIKDK